MIAKGLSETGEMNREVEEAALDEHGKAMVRVMEKADQLRRNTLKELVKILTPLQAIDFMVASKKLHLSLQLIDFGAIQRKGSMINPIFDSAGRYSDTFLRRLRLGNENISVSSSSSFKFNTGTQRPYKLRLLGKNGGPNRKSTGKELEGLVIDKVR
ncbi:hypothetical protein FF1_036570 [Malus domestica]